MKCFCYSQITISILLFASAAISQNTFYKQVITSDFGLPNQFAQSPNNNFIFNRTWSGLINPTQIYSLDDSGGLNWCIEIDGLISPPIIEGMVVDADNNITVLIEAHDGQFTGYALFQLNEFGEKKWDLGLDDWIQGPIGITSNLLSINANNDLFFAMITSQPMSIVSFDKILCGMVSQNGDLIWSKLFDMGEQGVVTEILSHSSDYFSFATIHGPDNSSDLLYNNTLGETIWSKSYNNFLIYQLGLFPNNDMIVSGKMGDYPVIMRVDNLGEPIWAKRLNAPLENQVTPIFPDVTADGNIICSYLGYSFLLDGDGNLLWSWNYRGIPISTIDGGYAFLSAHIDSAGNVNTDIKKTDSNGQVEGCESLVPCLLFEDVEVTANPGTVYPYVDIVIDTAFELSVVPANVQIEDYCPPSLEIPSTEFTAPSSVCVGDCFYLENLQQQDAEAWTWTCNGLSPSTSTAQDPGEICATIPGLYELKQVVSFLGCTDSFSLIIEVLSDIQPELGNDTLICEGGYFLLDATTAGANVYLWNDQSQNPVKEITTSGVYSITASNGQCSGADSMEVLFFKEQFPASTLNLGPSITECNGVVVSIDPSLPFGLTYEWEDGASGSFREFTEAGVYQLTGSLDQCSISGSVEIIFEKCEAKVYVPNAFSPNNDGINDLFEIYGNGFAPVQLKIFNRWGGLVFSQTGNDFRWNGEVKGKPAQPGVYVYLLDYVDIYNGEGKMIWGNIMVIN